MLYFVSFLGQFIGWFIANRTEEELKDGRRYFLILTTSLLALLISFSIYYSFNVYLLIIGLIIGYLINKEYLFFGILSMKNDILLNSLIFVYGLPYGSLNYKSIRILLMNILLFFIPFLLLFFNINFYNLGAGGLLGILVKRIYLYIK